MLQIVKYQIQQGDRWCDRWLLHGLNRATRRVLNYTNDPTYLPLQFYQWNSEAKLRAGDIIVYTEVTDKLVSDSKLSANESKRDHRQLWQGIVRGTVWKNILQKMAQWQLSYLYQTWRVAIICGITILLLLFGGTVLIRLEYAGISIREALSVTIALLLGGYAKNIIVLTDDDLENLETGLMAHAISPTNSVVTRTYDQHFSDNVARLFSYAQVLCSSALSAEVFAAA